MAFKSVPYESLSFNPFTKLGRQWGLVTAGTENGLNTMTVSWGGVGFIWNKPAVTVYIRPQRYTCLLYTSPPLILNKSQNISQSIMPIFFLLFLKV